MHDMIREGKSGTSRVEYGLILIVSTMIRSRQAERPVICESVLLSDCLRGRSRDYELVLPVLRIVVSMCATLMYELVERAKSLHRS